eukprot:Skav217010  [mRNA]  locus=scaffold1803:196379:196836:+ [translate_table: standard]
MPVAALPVVELAPAAGDRPCPRTPPVETLKDDARAVGAGTAGQSLDEEAHEVQAHRLQAHPSEATDDEMVKAKLIE